MGKTHTIPQKEKERFYLNTADMLTTYLSKLPNLIIALLVLLIGWGIAKIIEKAVYKGLQKQKSTTGCSPKKAGALFLRKSHQ